MGLGEQVVEADVLTDFPICRPRSGTAIVSDGADTPLAVLLQEAENVRPPMMYLTIDQEIIVRPDHGNIIIDENTRVIEALF